MSRAWEVVLAELGIVQWRARPDIAFPGGPPVQECGETSLLQRGDPSVGVAWGGDVRGEQAPSEPQIVDILLQAEAVTAAERELLQRMIEAVRGLRPGLRVASAGPAETSLQGKVSVRLDGQGLPDLAAMLADPALKRPVWQALKDAVACLS
ncbi:MAG: hypothetical protein ABWU16_03025 [Halothiobacillaceae bacterium]